MQFTLIIIIAIFLAAYALAFGIYTGRQRFVPSNDKILEGSFIVALMSFAAVGAFTIVYNIMFI